MTIEGLDKYPIDTRRLRRVLEVAGEQSGWGKRKAGSGWGLGIAAYRSFNTCVASVVEVEFDGKGRRQGSSHRAGRRCRVIVNPDRVRAQMEGAAVMAVGLARTGEITAAGGRIRQSDSGNLPTGVGEPGLPPVLAALGNAIHAATGKRVRESPLSKQKLA